MPQISSYIDASTLKKVKSLSKNEHKSISKWVGLRIKQLNIENWTK